LRLNQETIATGFEAKLEKTVTIGFEAKPEKSTLLVSTCTVQIIHNITQPLDRPTNEYPTCVIILGPLH
jgi:hypothetical protein